MYNTEDAERVINHNDHPQSQEGNHQHDENHQQQQRLKQEKRRKNIIAAVVLLAVLIGFLLYAYLRHEHYLGL